MAINGFDPYSYLAANTDLLWAGLNASSAEQHYTAFGQKEGRSTTFDAYSYIAGSADLRSTFGLNASAATMYYVSTGFKGGRRLFDSNSYLASNPDLISSGIRNSGDAAFHYIAYGANEGRSTDSFNAANYAVANSDLYSAFGRGATTTSKQNLYSHYVNYGFLEGRRTSPANWTGSGTVGPTGYNQLDLMVPAGRYRVEMFGASTGQGTLSDPFIEVGMNYIGFATNVTNDNGGAGLNARAEWTMYAITNSLSVRFRQSLISQGDGGTYQYAISIVN